MKHAVGLVAALLFIGSSIGVGCAAPPARAPQAADWKKIRIVINAQLEAFRRDDAIAAYSFAAPEIRSLFRTPGDFMRMVRIGYAAVYRPRSVRFLHHFMVAGRPVQPVEIVTGAEDDVFLGRRSAHTTVPGDQPATSRASSGGRWFPAIRISCDRGVSGRTISWPQAVSWRRAPTRGHAPAGAGGG